MTLKLRAKVNFPANVTATGGLAVAKANGVWTVEPDWSYLTLETTIPNAAGRQLWTFDPVNDVYYRLSVQALIDNLPAGPQGPTGSTGAGYGGTSATSLLIANSTNKVFTTQAGLAYQVGNYVRASSQANGANFMEGLVSAYSGTSLTIAVSKIGGSGTYADWAFQIAGAPGTGDLLSSNNLSDLANASTARTNLGIVANPSQTIGLTAVNGSANTAMRSDGAPALSQAITPTWTGAHIWSASGTFNDWLVSYNAAGGTDAKRWGWVASTNALTLYAVNDAFNATNPALTFTRSGYTVTGVTFGATISDSNGAMFSNIPQNSQSAAYTLVLSDAGKHIYHPSSDANARTFTIPANSSVAYPVGTVITFVNRTSQVVTIAINTDTLTLAGTTTTGSRSLAQNGIATALKDTSTGWLISGTGLT